MSMWLENLHDHHQGHAHPANRHHRRVAPHHRRSGIQGRTLPGPWMQCYVLAPSKMERPSGDRVKTDKRDCEWIARLVRLGELPVVVIASEGQEAARDLVRARADVRGDLMRSRHRLSKLLLRQGIVYEDTAWTAAHGKWLRSQSFGKPGVQFAFDEAYDTVLTTLARRDRLDKA